MYTRTFLNCQIVNMHILFYQKLTQGGQVNYTTIQTKEKINQLMVLEKQSQVEKQSQGHEVEAAS